MIEPLAYFRERQEHTFHKETNTFIQNYDREMPLGNNSSFYQGKKGCERNNNYFALGSSAGRVPSMIPASLPGMVQGEGKTCRSSSWAPVSCGRHPLDLTIIPSSSWLLAPSAMAVRLSYGPYVWLVPEISCRSPRPPLTADQCISSLQWQVLFI